MREIDNSVYLAIRKKIVDGVHEGGAHLATGDIATELNVSRTPVREALKQLEAEGFVTQIPNRGAFVKSWTYEDLDEVFDLWVSLEGHAARLAAKRISDAQIANLKSLADRMEVAAASGQYEMIESIASLNTEFHHQIVLAANQKRLTLALNNIVDMPLVVRAFATFDQHELDRAMTHHREIIDALEARDADWAKAISQCHVYAARRVLPRSGQGKKGEAETKASGGKQSTKTRRAKPKPAGSEPQDTE